VGIEIISARSDLHVHIDFAPGARFPGEANEPFPVPSRVAFDFLPVLIARNGYFKYPIRTL